MDYRTHRIPNQLTGCIALGGFFLNGWLNGWPGLVGGLFGLLISFIFFIPFYLLRWMGAGDVKLLMAVGVCLGWRLALLAGLSTLLLGAMASMLFLLVNGDLMSYLRRYWQMAMGLFDSGRFVYVRPESDHSAEVRFPYALVIALGTMAAIFGPKFFLLMRIPILSVNQ